MSNIECTGKTMTHEEKSRILERFTADEPGRYKLDKPFQEDGYLCATDGRICVRFKHDGPDDEGVPRVSDLQWVGEFDAAVPVPEFEHQEWEECPDCRGMAICSCDKCGHEHDCGCDGGEVYIDAAVLVKPNYRLSRKYLIKLREVGAKLRYPKNVLKCARIVIGDDIEGLLAPMAHTPTSKVKRPEIDLVTK